MSKANFALRTTTEILEALKDLAERGSMSTNEYINNVLEAHIESAGDIHSLRTLNENPRNSLIDIFNNNYYEDRDAPANLTESEQQFIIIGCNKALNNIKIARTRRQAINNTLETASVGHMTGEALFNIFGTALCGYLPRFEDRIEFAAMIDQPDIESRTHRFKIDETELVLLINGNTVKTPKEKALFGQYIESTMQYPLAGLIISVNKLNVTYGWETIASLYRVMSDFKRSQEADEQRYYADLHVALERRKGAGNAPLWYLIINRVQCTLSQEGIEQLANELTEFLGDHMDDFSAILGEY